MSPGSRSPAAPSRVTRPFSARRLTRARSADDDLVPHPTGAGRDRRARTGQTPVPPGVPAATAPEPSEVRAP